MSKEANKTVLAIYPTRYGIGYAVFDTPENLVDFGIRYVQPMKNKHVMTRVREYISFFKPDILLCRNVNDLKKRSGKRSKKLIDLICDEAKTQGLEIHTYNRTQIQNVFTQFGAKTKYQISQKIMKWYPILKNYEFTKRKAWETESYNTGVFDAVSLVMVHYYME